MSNRSRVQAGKKHIPSRKHTVLPIPDNHGQARNIQHPDLQIQGFTTTLLRTAAAPKVTSGHPRDLTTGVTALLQDLQTGVTALHQALQTGVTLLPQNLQAAEVILLLQDLQTQVHQEPAPEAVPHQAGAEDNLI